MCNADRCKDLHTIKTISDGPRPDATIETPVYNPLPWNDIKKRKHYIPYYPHAFYPHQYFLGDR